MYKILWKEKSVGNASIKKEGLTYYIECRCDLPKKGLYRVTVNDGHSDFDLGICVPKEGAYYCVSRVPCKRFCGNAFSFTLTDRKADLTIPFSVDKPFPYLDRLRNARLCFANGQPEIVIDPIPDPLDNDQNQAH